MTGIQAGPKEAGDGVNGSSEAAYKGEIGYRSTKIDQFQYESVDLRGKFP